MASGFNLRGSAFMTINSIVGETFHSVFTSGVIICVMGSHEDRAKLRSGCRFGGGLRRTVCGHILFAFLLYLWPATASQWIKHMSILLSLPIHWLVRSHDINTDQYIMIDPFVQAVTGQTHTIWSLRAQITFVIICIERGGEIRSQWSQETHSGHILMSRVDGWPNHWWLDRSGQMLLRVWTGTYSFEICWLSRRPLTCYSLTINQNQLIFTLLRISHTQY